MDIRKFFKSNSGSAAPAGGAPKPEPKQPKAEAKKEEGSGAAAAPPAAAAKKTSLAAAKSLAKKASPAAKPKAAAEAKAKPTPKRKKAQVIDDEDSDVEVMEVVKAEEQKRDKADSDFEVDLTVESDDGSEGWEVESEGEEEPAPKKRKSTGGKAAKAIGGSAEKKPPKPRAKSKSDIPAKKRTPAAKGGKKGPVPKALEGLSGEALAAVAAVDEAAKSLPAESELGITFLAEGSFNQRAPDGPPHWREKEPPRGHPDCLTGKTFVVSGVLDSLKREEAEDFIKRHGGKVTGNVSGRTSFLVVGAYCGRSKYASAKDHGTPMINEAGLFRLVEAAPDPNAMQEDAPAPQQAQQQQPPAAAAAAAPKPVPVMSALNAIGRSGGAGPSAPRPAAPAAAAAGRPPPGGTQLWVEKWRPKQASELVGNVTLVQTLRQWLHDWERVHLHGGTPEAPPGSGSGARRDKLMDDLRKKKAVLLSGPPGIGKTTSALILCRELGFEPVEVNASDTRGKADASVVKGVGGKLANAVKELSTNLAVSYDQHGRRKKLCLVMDEVDGMSAGDRGGVADLIQTIKASKVPILCICNDKYLPKLKSLRNHCLELDFRKPTAQQISKRMMEICKEEGLALNQATMEALVQTAQGDIRLVLGQLQMIRIRARSLSYDQVKAGGMGTAKDMEMSPFEAARKLLSFDADTMTLSDQLDLVFQDMDLVPLLVQENYLNHRPRLASNDSSRLQIIAKAADSLSGGDVVTRRVRQYQSWSLMPFAAALGTVTPAAWMRGGREIFGLFPGEANFPRFAAWLGNNSSQGKQRRLLGELHTRMLSSGNIETDRTGLRLSYLPVLRNTLVRPLAREGKEGIPAVLRAMREYCLAREDIEFITDVTKWKGTGASWKEDPMKAVETAVKSAFTRAFNQQHLKPKTGFGMDDKVSKKRGKGKGRAAAAAADEDEESDELGGNLAELAEGPGGQSPAKSSKSGEGDEEEEEELDPVAVRQKAMKLKSKGLTLTLKDGTQQATGRGAKAGSGRGRGRGAASGGRGGSGRGSGGGRGSGKGAASGRGGKGKK